jgi:hypothetical protein
MQCRKIYFSGHALQRMFEREISETEIKTAIETGFLIKEYPDDKPHASKLVLSFVEKQPLHVIYSTDKIGNCYIITAYRPSEDIWENNFTTKK